MNAATTWLFDLLVAPAIGLAPLTTLVAVSVATGLAMLWVVARTSNQAGVIAAKRGIQAGLFEIRLFNDDLGAVARALGRVLWQNLRYLGYSLVPLAWVALPLMLVIAQLQAFYGYEGLMAGVPTVVTATLREGVQATASTTASIEAPEAVRVDSPALFLPGAREILWRLVPTAAGTHIVTLRMGGAVITKTLHVDEATTVVARRSPVRTSGVISLLLYPSESPLPAGSPIVEVSLPYAEPGLDILGWRVHWLIVYVVVSMATAFAFARRMGVQL